MPEKVSFECTLCGVKEIKDLPQSVDALALIGNHFVEQHKNCKEK